jgi:hypothetical protein
VLDHFPILELVDIDNGIAARAGLAHGMIVDDHVVTIGEDMLDLAVVVREFLLQERNIGLEALRPIGGGRIMLRVARP